MYLIITFIITSEIFLCRAQFMQFIVVYPINILDKYIIANFIIQQ